jgi:hypothetical protein
MFGASADSSRRLYEENLQFHRNRTPRFSTRACNAQQHTALYEEYGCATLNLWTDRFSFVTILFVNSSVASEALVPKGIW